MPILLTVTSGAHAGRAFRFDRHDTFLVGRAPEAHFRAELFRKKLTEEPVPLASQRGEVPGELTTAVQRALARRAEERFADVAAFSRALKAFG